MKAFPFFTALLLLCSSLAYSTVVVTNGLTHIHDMSGRVQDEGNVLIKNIGKDPQRVVIYFEDLKISCSGEKDYVEPGSTDRSNSKWISVDTYERILNPGEQFPLKYKINAPEGLFGSFWSLLMVEVKNPIDTAELEYGIRIGSNIRYAVQIITNFNSQEPMNLEFRDVKILKENSDKFIEVQIENKADLMVTPLIKLEVFNESGEVIIEQKADRHKLYPGECSKFRIPLPKLKKGSYQGVVVADCGSDLFGTTINLTLDE